MPLWVTHPCRGNWPQVQGGATGTVLDFLIDALHSGGMGLRDILSCGVPHKLPRTAGLPAGNPQKTKDQDNQKRALAPRFFFAAT